MFWPSVSYQRRHEHNVARITSKKVIISEYSKELVYNWLRGLARAHSLFIFLVLHAIPEWSSVRSQALFGLGKL